MNKKIKFLGIPIGKECIKNGVYRKKILFHEIKFNLDECHITYRFLGIKYLTVTFLFGETSYNFFNIIKYVKQDKSKIKIILPVLVDYIKENLKTDTFDAICIFSHSGETFLSMYHMKEYIEKNQIKNPVFITNREYNTNITKMFFPEIPSIKIPNIFYGLYAQFFTISKIKDYSIRIYIPITHFIQFENSINNSEAKHFYSEIIKTMNVSSEITALPVISEENKEDAEAKMKLIGLKKPFIYVCSDTLSSDTYNIRFWEKLHIELFKLNQKINDGYDIFYNTLPSKSQNTYFKHCYLSFAQAKYVASQADIIIGVRSGLMDIIANTTSKIFCIYFPFYKRAKYLVDLNAEKVIQGFSLKQLPNVNPDNVYEYNTEQMQQDEIINEIISHIN